MWEPSGEKGVAGWCTAIRGSGYPGSSGAPVEKLLKLSDQAFSGYGPVKQDGFQGWLVELDSWLFFLDFWSFAPFGNFEKRSCVPRRREREFYRQWLRQGCCATRLTSGTAVKSTKKRELGGTQDKASI